MELFFQATIDATMCRGKCRDEEKIFPSIYASSKLDGMIFSAFAVHTRENSGGKFFHRGYSIPYAPGRARGMLPIKTGKVRMENNFHRAQSQLGKSPNDTSDTNFFAPTQYQKQHTTIRKIREIR